MKINSSSSSFYLSVTDLTAKYAPAYGGKSWNAVIEMFRGDPLQWQRIQDLAIELETNSSFDEPIALFDETVSYFDPNEDEPTILNGMHRLTAHLITGITPAKVHSGYPPVRDEWFGNMEFTFDQTLTENQFDNLLELGSFRVNEHCWGSLEGASSSGKVYTINFVDVPFDHAAQYRDLLVERMSAAKLPRPTEIRLFYELFESEG